MQEEPHELRKQSSVHSLQADKESSRLDREKSLGSEDQNVEPTPSLESLISLSHSIPENSNSQPRPNASPEEKEGNPSSIRTQNANQKPSASSNTPPNPVCHSPFSSNPSPVSLPPHVFADPQHENRDPLPFEETQYPPFPAVFADTSEKSKSASHQERHSGKFFPFSPDPNTPQWPSQISSSPDRSNSSSEEEKEGKKPFEKTVTLPHTNQGTDFLEEEQQQIGPYIIQGFIARGGMGEVLLAQDPHLNRQVAIKRLFPSLLEDEDAVERFFREARATAMISHPNIAGIYFVGADEDGIPFLAMEYVRGKTLHEIIRNRIRAPYSTICDWIIQASQGLEAASRLDIIHRDLKPANIMISEGGILKIVDFGLAKIFRDIDTHKTLTGMVMGTPHYMSPEQGQARSIDHRADIYSLGATFYHLLCGRPPFDGSAMMDIMMKHLNTPLVPVYSINPDVPLPLCDLIGKMMAKNPSERHQEYDDLITEAKALKLQFFSREKGALVHGEDNAFPNPNAPPSFPSQSISQASDIPVEQNVAPNADLQAIMGGFPQAPPLPENASPFPQQPVVIHNMNVTRPPNPQEDSTQAPPVSLTRNQMALIGFGAVVLILAALTFFLTPSEKTTGATSAPPSQAPRAGGNTTPDEPKLTRILERLLDPEQNTGRSVPKIPQELLAARATKAVLEEVSRAVASYESSQNAFPPSMQAITEQGLLPPTVVDGWQQEIVMRPHMYQFISRGGDGAEGTEDDFIVEYGESPELPEKYKKMEEEFLKKIKGENSTP